MVAVISGLIGFALLMWQPLKPSRLSSSTSTNVIATFPSSGLQAMHDLTKTRMESGREIEHDVRPRAA